MLYYIRATIKTQTIGGIHDFCIQRSATCRTIRNGKDLVPVTFQLPNTMPVAKLCSIIGVHDLVWWTTSRIHLGDKTHEQSNQD